MRRLLNAIIFASCLLVMATAQAAESPDAALLERVMGPRSLGLVRLDLEKVTAEQLAIPMAAGAFLFNQSEVENPDDLVAVARALHKAGPRYAYLVIGVPATLGFWPEMFCIVPAANEAEAAAAERSLRQLFDSPKFQPWQSKRLEGAVAIGTSQVLEANLADGRVAGREIAAALAAADEAPLAILMVPSPDQRRVLQEMLPLTVPESQRAVLTPELANFKWGMLAIGTDPQHALRIVTQHDSDVQAKAAGKMLQVAVNLLAKAVPAGQGLELLQPRAKGQQVRIEIDEQGLKSVTTAVEPEIRRLTSATARTATSHKLKMVGLAMHNYASANEGKDRNSRFPDAASRDAQGRPLLSWRVQLLPYLENGSELYRAFHLDEPWDSEHNKKLISQMPDVYRVGSTANIAAGKTSLVLPIGEKTLFPDGRGVAFKEVNDGLSNTIVAVEANDEHAVIWTRPDDLSLNSDEPAVDLGGHFGPGFLAIVADGSVQYFERKQDGKNIRALFTRDGGEPNER